MPFFGFLLELMKSAKKLNIDHKNFERNPGFHWVSKK